MILGLKYFGHPRGLYNLTKDEQLEVIGAHIASFDAATTTPDSTGEAPPLSSMPPESVEVDSRDAWERFRKFHDSVG